MLVPLASPQLEEEEEEEGFLDLLEIGNSSLEKATKAMLRIGEIQSENAARTQLNTQLVQATAQAPPDQRNRHAKQIFEIVSSDLNNLAKGLNEQAAVFTSAFSASMEATSKALAYQEFWSSIEPAERAQYIDALTQLETNGPLMELSLAELAETVAGLPRMTTTFNRAKKNAIAAIENVRTAVLRATGRVTDLKGSGFFNA